MTTPRKSRESSAGGAKGREGTKAPAVRPSSGSLRRSGGLLTLDDEQRTRLLIIGGVAAVLLFVFGLVLFGYWYSVVRPRGRTVLEVDGAKVSYAAMKRRMGYEYFQNVRYQQSQNAIAQLPRDAYNKLVDELTKVTQAEPRLGLTASDDEVTKHLRDQIGVTQDADARVFADAFRRTLDTSGLHEDEYRRMMKAEVLDDKITEKFKSELPLAVQQAKLEVIQAATKDDAQKAADRIKAGEDFATVAREVSQESDVQTTGGVHDYAPKGTTFPSAYDDYAFTAPVGQLSDPLSTSDNGPFYIVRVVDRSDQPVQESQKGQLASQKSAEWLQQTKDDLQAHNKIIDKWDTKSQSDALLALSEELQPRIRQRQQQQQQQQQAQATAYAQLTAAAGTPRATPPGDQTPVAEGTPAAGETAPAATAAAGGSTPSVPQQPVVPGNGQ
jgi:parvulin-like peptidyl-prolyl isomerase